MSKLKWCAVEPSENTVESPFFGTRSQAVKWTADNLDNYSDYDIVKVDPSDVLDPDGEFQPSPARSERQQIKPVVFIMANGVTARSDEERRKAERSVRGKYRRWFRRQFKRGLKDLSLPSPVDFKNGHLVDKEVK